MGSLLDASALLTHLSLSLSLCSQSPSAETGASTHLLAGSSHAPERGFCAARRRPTITAAPFACARVCITSLVVLPITPGVRPRRLRSRVYFPRAGSVGPKRRDPAPNPGSRRALLFAGPVHRGLFERHVSLPNGALVLEEV